MSSKSNRSFIVVNATALDRGGAFTILVQFVDAIPTEGPPYLLFVSDKVSLSCTNPNVRIVPISGVKNYFKRLWWDTFGVRRWLNRHHITPIAALSMQNTGFRVNGQVPTYVYYHQPVPFYPYRWSPFKKRERSFWFYKNIYPFFVRLFLRQETQVFVQLQYIKDGFTHIYGHSPERIHIITPELSVLTTASPSIIDTSDAKLHLFYPASAFFYKNHNLLFEALGGLTDRATLYATSCKKENFDVKHIPSNCTFLGYVSFDEIVAMYRDADALVFPSYIETFGLPLTEAAALGTPVIAADLPYAREVLSGYTGVTFVDHTDAAAWSRAITTIEKGKKYPPLTPQSTAGWKSLFDMITANIPTHVQR